ncbi:tetratricopeptide (TPR) repeat protein [Granulicella aggregans]|uniref:Tetratricopeptide (TPR) repeat protein n=1 Tax=Granulicella aggregans TaxID=474949 RepID=A0A7W8E885_9BACT|nr:tetratricopeptide (TPR) repeat protein [Granulicella aggregans]
MPKPRAKPSVPSQAAPSFAGARLDLLIYLALLVATFAVYAQVRNFDFVNYDDGDFITNNLNVRQGITAQGLKWALTTGYEGNWVPLTWVSHMVDCQFFGLDSGWHHLNNVLLHALAAIMLCMFLQRATGTRWRSALAGFLFALHPLHVQSVAWVAERKDVLSACFWFLTMWLYVRYAERPSTGRYLAVALSFWLGLMAKPMMITLPFVLLLLDYWPLARLRRRGRKVIWEKLPLLGLAGAASAITYLAQKHSESVNLIPIGVRLENAAHSYALYIFQTFWPTRLAVLYPYPPDLVLPLSPIVAAGVLLGLITTGVVVLRSRAPYLLTGWGWYVVTLVPVIGFVQVGDQAHADRYMYIPMVGLLIMLIWGAAEILEQLRARMLAIPLAAAACLVAAVVSWVEVGYWRNGETLFRRAIAVTNDNKIADNNLGSYLMNSGRVSEALPYLETAVRIDPEMGSARNNLGSALGRMGRVPEAIEQLQVAVRLWPDSPDPHTNLGTALAQAGRIPEAADEFEAALRMDPNDALVQKNLGQALSGIPGRLPDALRHLEEADRLSPDPEVEQAIAQLRAAQQ